MKFNPIAWFCFVLWACPLVSHGGGPSLVTTTLPGGATLTQVRIPAGSFLMGSPSTERARQGNEDPTHTVILSQDFYMGMTEVTQKQWLAVMGSWPGAEPATMNGLGDNYPAYNISWNDIAGAGGFIEKLNQYVTDSGQGEPTFRLPSEAEWEYACRAGTSTRFYFGDSLSTLSDGEVDGPTDSLDYPGNRSNYMWFGFNSNGNSNGPTGCKTAGTKPANPLGLKDMAGNLWEWCQDRYGTYTSKTVVDPHGPSNGSTRVLRGGGWVSPASHCRSAFRLDRAPDNRTSGFGFRVARSRVTANGVSIPWHKME